MKTFAQAAVIFMIVIVTFFVCFNLITGNVTDNETEKTLSQSVEQALYTTLDDKAYTIDDKNEFIADFLTNLALSTQSKGAFDVHILAVDASEGLLDVEVIETLTYPDGKDREVRCRKTVILEGEMSQ